MERLLEDAGKLAGMEFKLGNYGDIVQAIHVIQENLDITGTTAKEAADTIEGSMNSTKAAIDNLVVGFARSDADIDKLIEDVEDNIKNVAKNVIPVAERAFVSMGNAAIDVGKEILDELPSLIDRAMTEIHKTIADGFGESAKYIYAVEAATKVAAAAFVTYKAAAYVADVVDGIKMVNAALAEGVTLQEAMNAANLANPYVLLATAAVAAGVAIKSVVDTQTDLINETGDYYNMLSAEQKQFLETAEQETEAIKTNANERKKSIGTTLDEISTYQTSIDRLYELNSMENKTAENKAEMAALVERLNKSIDGLNIKYDEQTGKLKTNKKSVDDLIDSYIREAKVAAAKDNIIKILSDQEKAEKNLEEAKKNQTKAQEEYNFAFNQLQGAREDASKVIDPLHISEESQRLKEVQEQYDIANDNLARYNQEVQEQTAIVNGLAQEMEGVRESLSLTAEEAEKANNAINESTEKTAEGLSQAMGFYKDEANDTIVTYAQVKKQLHEFTEEQMTDIAKLVDAYDEAYQAQFDAISKSVDLYEGFTADTSTTYDDLYSNLQQSKFYLDDWTTAIDQLQAKVDKGLMSQEFLDSLKSMGLDSWNIVYDMNHATGEQLKKYSDLWDETNKTIKTSTDTLMAGQKEAVEEDLESITGIADAKIENYRHSFELLGLNIAKGLEDGLSDKLKDLKKSGAEAFEATYDGIYEEGDFGSPSKEMEKLGKWAAEGFAVGMNEGGSIAETAARNLAVRAINAMIDELDIGSPSKVMKELGGFTGQGFAIGMESAEKDVLDAADLLAESATSPLDGLTPTAVNSPTTYAGGAGAAQNSAQGAQNAQQYVFNLITPDGTLIGRWIAPYIDMIQGKNAAFSGMGYAT